MLISVVSFNLNILPLKAENGDAINVIFTVCIKNTVQFRVSWFLTLKFDMKEEIVVIKSSITITLKTKQL